MSDIKNKEEILLSLNSLERAILEVCSKEMIEDIMNRKKEIQSSCKDVAEVWREYIKNG